MELVNVCHFGADALATAGIVVCPPAAYALFKVTHLGFHAAMDTLYPAPPRVHAFMSDAPPAWPKQWSAPTRAHQVFFSDVYAFWGSRDDGALGCIRIGADEPARKAKDRGKGKGAGRGMPVHAVAEGVPSLLRALLDPRVSTPNPLLDVAVVHSALTCRVALSLLVALAFDGTPPALYRVCGATAGSRVIEPPASHDGQAALVWDLRHPRAAAALRAWEPPADVRGHVGTWVLTCPVRTNGGAGVLLLFPVHADAGMLHPDWASGLLPARLARLAAESAPVPLEAVDALALPWLPTLRARSRVPALEGLVHAQWPGDDMDAGAAVVEGAVVHATWAWEAPPSHARATIRTPLTLPEGVALGMVLVLAGTAVVAMLMPGHVLGRTAAAAPKGVGAVYLDAFVPWGRQ